ncbi:MAG: 50S ribosomal protein L29 [Minisyncoccia bacterium]
MAKTQKKLKEGVKGMKSDELVKKLGLLREEIRAIHFKSEGAKSKNVKEISGLKKQIARILTEINKANK